MKINCLNLACPKPVIETKNALEKIEENETLEVLVDNDAAVENVQRFAHSLGHETKVEKKDDVSTIFITKTFTCNPQSDTSSKIKNEEKILFLKDDKVGEGELGEKLIIGFLNSILELPSLPQKIICVNRAVFLVTKNKDSIEVFKKFEEKGVEIFSCGVCLDFFNVKDDLQVGVIGNAYSIVDMLTSNKGVISL